MLVSTKIALFGLVRPQKRPDLRIVGKILASRPQICPNLWMVPRFCGVWWAGDVWFCKEEPKDDEVRFPMIPFRIFGKHIGFANGRKMEVTDNEIVI